jgi:hypothetical protein
MRFVTEYATGENLEQKLNNTPIGRKLHSVVHVGVTNSGWLKYLLVWEAV